MESRPAARVILNQIFNNDVRIRIISPQVAPSLSAPPHPPITHTGARRPKGNRKPQANALGGVDPGPRRHAGGRVPAGVHAPQP